MANTETLYFSVKSDIKDTVAAQKEWNKHLEETNQDIKLQTAALNDMKAELVRLEKLEAKLGKGSWAASMAGTTKKIEKQKLAIKGETVAMAKLKATQKEATTQVNKFNKAQDEQSKELTDGIGNFNVMGVSLNGIRNSFGKIIPVSKAMFASVRAGIISTGVGAFIVAIGSLIAYFTSTKKGADQLKVAFTAIGAAVTAIKDRISKFGGAIVKLFKGDIKGAIGDVKEATTGLIDEIKEEVKVMSQLEKASQRLRDAEMAFGITKAETRKEIEKARLAAEDESLSAQERLKNLKIALELEEETTQKELELAREAVRIQEMQMKQSENMVEDEQKLADLRVALIEKETGSMKMRRRVMTEVNSFENEIAAEAKARADQKKADDDARQAEIDAANLKRQEEAKKQADEKAAADLALKELQDENMLAEIEDLNERALAELDIQQRKEEDSLRQHANFLQLKEQLDIKYENARKALTKQELTWDKITTKEKLGLASDAFGQLSKIMGEETKAGKAAAITQATIQTYLGATQAFTSLSAIPVVGPGLGIIAAGAAIAAGFKNIKAIRQGSETEPDAPDLNLDSASVDAPIQAPSAEMMSGAFSLGGGAEPDPVRAFVVTDEMSNSQEQLGEIRRTSTL
tara:strand:+ start:3447 stop:5348 length:1902 start_codon:yes stop_codon:yes gene_type:complete